MTSSLDLEAGVVTGNEEAAESLVLGAYFVFRLDFSGHEGA